LQVVQSSAEVFEEDISPTAGFSGTVQYVSEKPSFGVEVAGVNQQKPKKRENQVSFSATFYSKLLHAHIPKVQKRLTT